MQRSFFRRSSTGFKSVVGPLPFLYGARGERRFDSRNSKTVTDTDFADQLAAAEVVQQGNGEQTVSGPFSNPRRPNSRRRTRDRVCLPFARALNARAGASTDDYWSRFRRSAIGHGGDPCRCRRTGSAVAICHVR